MIKSTIRFMAVRNIAFTMTLVLTLVGLGALFAKGLNFGLDFTGGTLIELQYEQPADLELINRMNSNAPATKTGKRANDQIRITRSAQK